MTAHGMNIQILKNFGDVFFSGDDDLPGILLETDDMFLWWKNILET